MGVVVIVVVVVEIVVIVAADGGIDYFAFFTHTNLFPTEDWPTWTFSQSLTLNALSS